MLDETVFTVNSRPDMVDDRPNEPRWRTDMFHNSIKPPEQLASDADRRGWTITLLENARHYSISESFKVTYAIQNMYI